MNTKSGTNRFYQERADTYAEITLNVDMSKVYDRFLSYLPKPAMILDAGSGSGRDTLAFKNFGHEVHAFDASPALCAFSTQLTGVPTKVDTFQNFKSEPVYDGIWACASLLHVQADELADAVSRLVHALKPEGALYMSFKYGSGERFSEDGRYYQDMNVSGLQALLSEVNGVNLSEVWLSQGENNWKDRVTWINAIVTRDWA